MSSGSSLPVKAPRDRLLPQVLPAGSTVTFTLEVVLAHVTVPAENRGARLLFAGTLHATWLSAVGAVPAMKVHVPPLLQGKGPVTLKVLPLRRYLQLGTTLAQSAYKNV